VRARAAGILVEVAYRGASLDAALSGDPGGLQEIDRALLKELCFGTLRWFWRCEAIVGGLLERPLRRRDRIIEALMLVGVYQLNNMRLPPHAAIHATVDACVTLGRPGYKGLVNAVLRNFQRRREALIEGLPAPARDGHPEWLWQAIQDQWPDRAGPIVAANNSRPPMTLRVNIGRLTVARYIDALRAAGIEGRSLAHAPAAVTLDEPVDVHRLPGFERGWVSVQDASAQMLTRLIDLRPGQRVLDACAAPGGKLTHMLESYPGVEAQAVEADPGRAGRIRENLARLGLESEVIVADAADLEGWWDRRRYDVVVLDAPCSGTGVIRRHPDIKVLRRPSDVERFAAAQQRLLERLWRTVKPGGRLVYVTCSILARENQEQVSWFLQRTPDGREEPIELPAGSALERGWQIVPDPQGGDGFYYAVIRNTAGEKR
jgi:16S rRNA (cytosine967-C5)-methyltransferase